MTSCDTPTVTTRFAWIFGFNSIFHNTRLIDSHIEGLAQKLQNYLKKILSNPSPEDNKELAKFILAEWSPLFKSVLGIHSDAWDEYVDYNSAYPQVDIWRVLYYFQNASHSPESNRLKELIKVNLSEDFYDEWDLQKEPSIGVS